MHQEKAGRGRHCNFCGRDMVVTATIRSYGRDKLRICCDCAAAALRLLSSRAAGERVNNLAVVRPPP